MPRPRFPKMSWPDAIDRVEKCLFRVIGGSSSGTCFIISIGSDENKSEYWTTFVTAWHVIKDMAGSAEDIQLISADGKKSFDSKEGDLIAFSPLGADRFDSAFIYLRTDQPLVTIKELLPIFPSDSMLARGADIGWLGYPGISNSELCFFHGYISGYQKDPPIYFVDGVAINGVSGGPAFDDRAHLVGFVTSYIPNRVDEFTTLPGLLCLVPINVVRIFLEELFKPDVL